MLSDPSNWIPLGLLALVLLVLAHGLVLKDDRPKEATDREVAQAIREVEE